MLTQSFAFQFLLESMANRFQQLMGLLGQIWHRMRQPVNDIRIRVAYSMQPILNAIHILSAIQRLYPHPLCSSQMDIVQIIELEPLFYHDIPFECPWPFHIQRPTANHPRYGQE